MGRIQEKEEKAELCGAILGDGWIQSNEQSFFIAGDPTEDREYYDFYLPKIFEKLLVPVKPKEFPYWKVYGISIHKKEIVKKIINWGVPKGKKAKTANVPAWILEGSEGIIKSFLRGFFDADGSVFCQKAYGKYNSDFDKKYHSKIRLRITTISSSLAEGIFILCSKLGLRITKIVIKGGFRNNRNYSDTYLININEIKSINRWFKEISPSNQKHITKFKIWEKYGFCPPYTTIKQRKEILKSKLNPYSFY